jgi:oxalate decarboxylase
MKPQVRLKEGSRITVTKKNFPLLQGMSFYKLALEPNAVREPHWHANADELGYCLKGNILVSMFATGNKKSSFLIRSGEAFLIPSGSLHAIENIGNETAELILQFSHEEPEDFGLSAFMGMFSDAVLGNTWHVSSQKFQPIKRSTKDVFFITRQGPAQIPETASYASPYRYNLASSPALISTHGGQARVARQDVWPALKRQALYSLSLNGTGMREPHWHPETAEMGYVAEGKGRMSILSPSASVDTYEMNAGDLYFIPKAYPHHIENLSDGALCILIFFDESMPGDIGLTASVKSFSDEILTPTFNAPKGFFSSLPTYYEDLFIVDKINAVDPSYNETIT